MKSYDLYAKLELIATESEQTTVPSCPPKRATQSVFQPLLNGVQTCQKWLHGWAEPRVHHRRDRQGKAHYEVYDPVSRQRFHCESEAEVRAWLEQRYYRH